MFIALAKTWVHEMKQAPKKLRKNKRFMLQVVKHDGLALQYASREQREDPDVVKRALEQNGLALQYTAKAMRQNFDLVLCAAKQNGFALQFAGNELCKNAEIISAACNQDPEARCWVATEDENWEDESSYVTEEDTDEDSEWGSDNSNKARPPKRQKNKH